jgi:hypothetical protein
MTRKRIVKLTAFLFIAMALSLWARLASQTAIAVSLFPKNSVCPPPSPSALDGHWRRPSVSKLRLEVYHVTQGNLPTMLPLLSSG